MSNCGVCSGLGEHPIYDRAGRERYVIRCVACGGTGEEGEEGDDDFDDEDDEEDEDGAEEDEENAVEPLPPPSTAFRIRSVDELREWVKKQRGETT